MLNETSNSQLKTTYTDFIKTDFFQINMFGQEKTYNYANQRMLKTFHPFPFEDFIYIELLINHRDEIIKGLFRFDREWMGDVENLNPFAREFAINFILAIVPSSDKEIVEELAKYIWGMKGGQEETSLFFGMESEPEKKTFSSSHYIQNIINVYLDLELKAKYDLKDSVILTKNVVRQNKPFFILEWKTINSTSF